MEGQCSTGLNLQRAVASMEEEQQQQEEEEDRLLKYVVSKSEYVVSSGVIKNVGIESVRLGKEDF